MTIAILVGLLFLTATVGAYVAGYWMGRADECLSRVSRQSVGKERLNLSEYYDASKQTLVIQCVKDGE